MDENQQSSGPAGVEYAPQKKSDFMKVAAVSFGLIVMFGLGFLVGDDRIRFSDTPAIEISNSESSDISTEDLQEIYNKLVENYDGEIDVAELEEGLKRGFVAAVGDSFTEYLSPQETSDFNASLNGTFEGIGAELGKEGNFVIIVSPIKGAPAEAAGIQPLDVILEIDGEDATDISISDAVQRIRGEKGTDVTLTLLREGERVETTITRDTIDIPSVEWEIQDGVGVISIGRFGDDTVQLVRQATQELSDQGVTSFVLDMRGNPGGLLDAAVGVSDIFLPKGALILEEKQGDTVIRSFTSDNNPVVEDANIVVLINEGSASASEIVAGALRDNERAILVGQTSFGKGSVQQLIDLLSGGSLKVTIARWFTPADKNIDKEGIMPDEIVELTSEDREAERDPQLDKAKELLTQ